MSLYNIDAAIMALVDPDKRDEIIRTVSDSYLKTFPELEGKYSVHVCRSADGVAQGGTL